MNTLTTLQIDLPTFLLSMALIQALAHILPLVDWKEETRDLRELFTTKSIEKI